MGRNTNNSTNVLMEGKSLIITTKAGQTALSDQIYDRIIPLQSWLLTVRKSRLSDGDIEAGVGVWLKQQFHATSAPRFSLTSFDLYMSRVCRPLVFVKRTDKSFGPRDYAQGWQDLCRHVSNQLSAIWANYSLIASVYGSPLLDRWICDRNFGQYCATGIANALMHGVEKVFKFLHSDVFNFYEKQNELETPPPLMYHRQWLDLFPVNRRELKQLRYFGNRRDRSVFVQSILMAKKGTFPLPPWERDFQMSKIPETMSQVSPPDPLMHTPLCDAIKRVVRQTLWRLPRREKRDSSVFLVPSVSAHQESKRSHGGASSYLLKELQPGQWTEDPRFFEHLDSLNITVRKVPGDLLHYIYHNKTTMDPTATVHEVLEPFKLRTITTGNSFDGYLFKYFNRLIHTELGNHPVFKYTHQTIAVENLQDVVLEDGELWGSVDYSSATDLLKSVYSEHALACICDLMGWSSSCYDWMRKHLCETLTSIPRNDGTQETFQQHNGQWMGSSLSFPILCIVNAACMLLSEEKGLGRKIRVKDMRSRINGDDALTPLFPKNYPWLKRLVSAAGLNFSIGKNYLSPHFCMINSVRMESEKFLEHCDVANGRQRIMRTIPYINVGLIKGTGRVLSDTRKEGKDSGDKELGECAAALIKGFDHARAKVLTRMFIDWNIDQLRGSQDWWLPTHLGGLGLPLAGYAGVQDIPPLSRHAAIVASYAQSVYGLNFSKVEPNPTALRCRQSLPMERVVVDDEVRRRREESSSCNDHHFWDHRSFSQKQNPSSQEEKFKQALRKGIKNKCAPLKDRTLFGTWTWEPLLSLLPQRVSIPFGHERQ